ncbi:hypothetical protein IID23_02090 [Patescibacteria group bacterium]|nr:hypothetical protein [Patescibacteria group bacterium]
MSTQRSSDLAPEAKATQLTDNEIVEDQTLKLLSLNSDLKGANSSKKQTVLKQMEDIAKDRENLLSSLIEKDPEEVLKVSIPETVKDELPIKIQSYLENNVELKGALEVLHIDDFDKKEGEFLHFLQTKKKKYSLYSEEPLPNFISGTNVEVSGVAIGDKVAVEGKIKKNPKVLAASDTTGVQKNVVLLVNFQNDTTQRFTNNSAAGVVFNNSNSVNAFYQENSYNKTSLPGDVFGWYTLPINKTCSFSTIQSEAVKAADADVNFQNYTGIIIAFPGSCGWAGLAYVGRINVSTADGIVRTRLAWVIDRFFDLRVVGHEVGHGYGVWHANAYECGSEAITDNCSSVSYGDPYDIMGSSRGHFNAYHKELFSWFDASNIKTVSTNGIYSIEPFETATVGTKILKVPRDRDAQGNPITWLYLEYRQQTGFDSSLSGNVYDGALIHYGPKLVNQGDTQLIDTTPQTSSRTDGALVVNQTVIDTDTGVTIQTINKTSNSLDLEVSFGPLPCVRANPSVVITPTQVFAVPGSTENFTITVTNNDRSECGSSTFTLSPTFPTGWSGSLAASQLSINAESSVSTTLNVTSDSNADDGFYAVTVLATNTAVTNFKNSDTVTYVISNDIDNPVVSITSPLNGDTVLGTITVSASAADNVGITKVEFYLDNSLKSTDGSAPYSFRWNTKQVSDGTHSLSAKVFDSVGNVGISTVVSVSVSNIDTQPPSIPSGLRIIQVSETQVNLFWNPSSDNVAVTGYKIFRDGNLLTSINTTYYEDRAVVVGRTYRYTVSAFDRAGNESTASSSVDITVKDHTRPSVPSGLRARVSSSTRIDLTWNASSDNVGVAGYRIYRNNRLIKTTTAKGYRDSNVSAGKTYSYQVSAFDAAGNTSARSSVVKVSTPGTGVPKKRGDLNGDSKINIRDLSILISRWGTSGGVADINGDGRVNIRDLSILISQWGR